MEKKMNINQAEKLTGVSKRNIRFYENEGLLQPHRDDISGYRKYGEDDIWRIKVIKMLRMLDMPLEEISDVLDEKQSLEQAVIKQRAHLEEKEKELQAAIRYCDRLKTKEIQKLDVEKCLEEMEQSQLSGFFISWMDDYKTLKEENKNRDFTFIPDEPIRNAREFTNALFAYATKENLDLVITKESIYPEFTIDGIEYTAERYYIRALGVPMATVSCHRKDREIKGENIPTGRRQILWLLQKYWIVFLMLLIDFAVIVGCIFAKATWETWVIVISISVLLGLRMFWFYNYHFNEKV